MTQEQRQEAFNKAYIGLMKQGTRATRTARYGSGANEKYQIVCAYYTDTKTRCAIGQILSEELAEEAELQKIGAIEDIIADAGNSRTAAKVVKALNIESEDDEAFYDDLQRAHDTATDETLKECLHEFAEMYSLIIPEVL